MLGGRHGGFHNTNKDEMGGRLVRTRHLGCVAALAAFSLSSGIAAANCQLQQTGTLAVDMQGLRPLVSTKINGVKARFMIDTGAFYSTIWRDTAAQYRLPITSLPDGGNFYISGAGGNEKAWVGTVQSFQFLEVPIAKVQFIVIDQTLANDYVGILGENLLEASDTEYDLANGIMRFFRPVGCGRQALAYWATSTPYSSVDLESIYDARFHLSATATLNGHRISVWFDTGASNSVVSLEAAARAGITPDSAGVTFLGQSRGIGPASTKVWSAPVDSFQLGGEKIQHTHLQIANLEPGRRSGEFGNTMPDMLLGDDFFLSHRVYVAYSRKKLYFTYNGGPLFNLNLPQVANGGASPPPSSAATQPGADAPTDADGFRRRGMAYASMHEVDLALADLTRACELAPSDAGAHYERGLIYAEDGQPNSALQDFSTAITLQPDDIDARLARAQLLQRHPDSDPASAAVEVKSDLDAVSKLAAPTSNLRLALGQLYARAGDYPAALDQVNLWLSSRPLRDEQAVGLGARCSLRAAANQDLREALKDCDAALNVRQYAPEQTGTLITDSQIGEDPVVLDSRALVYLRLGNLNDAIHDYASALQINPGMPTSLYGRGVAELRLGEKTQGQADLAAAEKLDTGVAQRFAKMGVAP